MSIYPYIWVYIPFAWVHILRRQIFIFSRAQVFEEEDFQPMGYGYRLGSNPQTGNSYDASQDVTEQKCISMLREQEEELNKKVRSTADDYVSK